MTSRLDRRRFFVQCASSASAATLLPVVGGGLGAGLALRPAAARGIEPIQRSSGAQFQFSLAAYSYRNLLQGQPPQLTLSDFIRDGASLGLDGVELTSYYFPQPLTRDYLTQLKGECFKLGLDISGTAVGNDFGLAPGADREAAIADVKQWVEHAQLLGAPVIRIFAGHVPAGEDPAVVHRRMVAAIEECCDYAGRFGVHLALENHGGPTATADGLLAFVRDVQSPWFGVNLDTGNFRTPDVYGDLARVAPYAINVQVKVAFTPADGPREATDFARLAQILRDAGYRGYIVLEYEEDGDPRAESRQYLDQIRAAFAS